ncbi:hypothetical protein DIS18_06245 [Algibacter marinivivus]|uniref:CarboxypepD_reg-like domain-containing protein n=1 Tax=Algibacter marinivivus TaxID=2100723 RepID=A0A2U2X8R7_9FLAO|nr:carboxypeptidase-like regulatory domain-containing protein [Algibacter marinivivus]PWH84140.1 hypothetical protein DIS18_06245 [Algibacter marinivivus]
MKQILYIALFFISALSYAQSTGSINGNLLDFESNNQPLMFAKVSIKETGATVLSDEKGVFKFKNLNDGEYTLVSSFTGYNTKETKITVASNKIVTAKIVLEASTISLEDLVATMASADNSSSSTVNN